MLDKYYKGEIVAIENNPSPSEKKVEEKEEPSQNLLTEKLKPRDDFEPLLLNLEER